MQTTEIAWAAGFLEGEGTFTHTGKNMRVAAFQVNREPLEKLQRIFGGNIAPTKPYKNSRPGFIWYLGKYSSVIGCCFTIYCFMSERRREKIAKIAKWWKIDRKPLKIHCPRGHIYHRTAKRNGGTQVRCRLCNRADAARRWRNDPKIRERAREWRKRNTNYSYQHKKRKAVAIVATALFFRRGTAKP